MRGRGRALPPNLLASHNLLTQAAASHNLLTASNNLLTASHNYNKEVRPQNQLSSHNSYISGKELSLSNQPSHKTYHGVKNTHSFYHSQAEDKEHFPANPYIKHKPHKKENEMFPSQKSKFDNAENPFSLDLPQFFEQRAEPQSSSIANRFQWSPTRLRAPRRRLIDRAGWESEKDSWSEGRRAEAEGPPFGDVLERFGRRKQRVDEEERSGRGGWKPLSEASSWSTTPDIWTNEVANCGLSNAQPLYFQV